MKMANEKNEEPASVRDGVATVRGNGAGTGTIFWNGTTTNIPPNGEVLRG
jgi:hypothetical protein